jgi:hypothetical protein
MTSIAQILEHKDTTIVESTDICNAFVFWTGQIKEYLLATFTDYKWLIDKTCISPNTLYTQTNYDENFFNRHRHTFSGRSFSKWYTHNSELCSINIKGGHLLENGEIRDPQSLGMRAPPARGCETVAQLHKEFTNAEHLQNLALEIYWTLAPLPIPLKVSRLDYYQYKGEVIDYKEMMFDYFTSCETHKNNLTRVCVFANTGIHYTDTNNSNKVIIKEEFANAVKLIPHYWDNIWEHGSYMYVNQWTSMRIADVLKVKTREEMQVIIRSYYPQNYTDKEICAEFMEIFAQARGHIDWSGLHFKAGRMSKCFLVDTTIMGHQMDIDGYTFHDSGKEYRRNDAAYEKHHNELWTNIILHQKAYSETAFFFYSIFFPASINAFQEMYIKFFLDTYTKYFATTKKYKKGRESIDTTKMKAMNLCRDVVKSMLTDFSNTSNILADEKYIWNLLSQISVVP